MHLNINIISIFLVASSVVFTQDLPISKTGVQTFYFKDPQNRNQLIFSSDAVVETFNGVTNDVRGEISFDPANLQNTLNGEISTSVKSIRTEIEARDEDLYSERWLNAEKHPEITFKIMEVNKVMKLDDNQIKISVSGDFVCNGRTITIFSDFTLKYLEESELTKSRIPGDLLSIVGEFEIKLSDFGIRNAFINSRVAEIVAIRVNMVGTNKKPV